MAGGGGGAIPVTARQRAAVAARLRERTVPPRLRERLEMVKAAALGQDEAAIARWSGRSPRPVRHWLGRFLARGIAALAHAPRPGRPPRRMPPLWRHWTPPSRRRRPPSACRLMSGRAPA